MKKKKKTWYLEISNANEVYLIIKQISKQIYTYDDVNWRDSQG